MNLGRIDKKILRLLQEDGRLSNSDLAEKVNISKSACWNKTRALIENGFIKGFKAILNPEKIEIPTLVCVGVVLDRSTPDSFSQFEVSIKDIPEVLECLLLAGEFDYILKIRVKDVNAFNKLHAISLLRLPGIRQLRSFFVLQEIKSTLNLPVL